MTADADVAAAKGGNQEAFGRLVEARWDRLVRLARAVAGDVDAEDIAQDACVVCWRKLSQLSEISSFDSWLMRIVFTAAARRARWSRWRNTRQGTQARTSATDDPAGAILVWQVLARLPARQRAVVHMTIVEGMTDTEIAQALGIRAGSVRAHRRRASDLVDKWWRQYGNAGSAALRHRSGGTADGAADERAAELRRGAAPMGGAVASNEGK